VAKKQPSKKVAKKTTLKSAAKKVSAPRGGKAALKKVAGNKGTSRNKKQQREVLPWQLRKQRKGCKEGR